MMFLLKAAFWLGLVLVLLPTGSKKQEDSQINAAEAATAATSTVADLSQFCTRRPEACAVGSQVANLLGQRAQAGAKMVYEFITERREGAAEGNGVVPASHKAAAAERDAGRPETTGSVGTRGAMMPRPRPAHSLDTSQDTLTAGDRRPAWRAPELRQEAKLRHPG